MNENFLWSNAENPLSLRARELLTWLRATFAFAPGKVCNRSSAKGKQTT
jgi:hypothetical protein